MNFPFLRVGEEKGNPYFVEFISIYFSQTFVAYMSIIKIMNKCYYQ